MSNRQTIACKLSTEELNNRRQFELKQLFKGKLQLEELENGYEFYFPSDRVWFDRIVKFIEVERQYCPFLHFELIISPDHHPFRLKILGSAEVKKFVREIMLFEVDLPING